jgi:hypothetical protein
VSEYPKLNIQKIEIIKLRWPLSKMLIKKRLSFLTGAVLALGFFWFGFFCNAMKRAPSTDLLFVDRRIPEGRLLAVKIPAGSLYWVVPALSASGQVYDVADFAKKHNALSVMNAGYFDPNNRQTTSFVLTPSQGVADPRQNKRLMESKTLQPYLKQILNRSEWRVLICSEGKTAYQIALAQDPLPTGCRLVARVGGGPRLLPEEGKLTDRFKTEAFVDGPKENKGTENQDKANYSRDPIGVDQPNARSAVGLTEAGDVWLVMVAQEGDSKKSDSNKLETTKNKRGVSLSRLANLMKDLGVKSALNLDGGTSSQLWYKGQHYIGKVRPDGEPVTRKVKSVLMVVPISQKP